MPFLSKSAPPRCLSIQIWKWPFHSLAHDEDQAVPGAAEWPSASRQLQPLLAHTTCCRNSDQVPRSMTQVGEQGWRKDQAERVPPEGHSPQGPMHEETEVQLTFITMEKILWSGYIFHP